MCAHDGWMDAANTSSWPCSPDVRIYGTYMCACTHTYMLSECTDWCVTPSALSLVCKKWWRDQWWTWRTRCKPSSLRRWWSGSWRWTRSHTRKAMSLWPDEPTVWEGDLSQTIFINKMTRGLVCPLCNIHDELVRLGGPSGVVRERGSNVWTCVVWDCELVVDNVTVVS